MVLGFSMSHDVRASIIIHDLGAEIPEIYYWYAQVSHAQTRCPSEFDRRIFKLDSIPVNALLV
jgi:hypothetical protein